MILSDSEMNKFEFRGDSFPLRCDLLVLEKIQDKVGDIMDAENEIRGFKPRVDSDGVVDTTVGRWTIPNISLVTQSLVWMMEEAREITNGQYQIPTTKDLKQQDDYTIAELATIVYREFSSCIAGKKKEENQSKEEDGYRDSSKKCLIDFSWLIFVGLQCRLSRTEIQREPFWRMQELVQQWKRQQNAVTKQCVWNIDE